LIRPLRPAPISMVRLQKLSTCLAMTSSKLPARPSLKSSSFQRCARMPARMEPPDTLVIRSSLPSRPPSFRRLRLPRPNSVARKPPPERARPMVLPSIAKVWVLIGLADIGSVCGVLQSLAETRHEHGASVPEARLVSGGWVKLCYGGVGGFGGRICLAYRSRRSCRASSALPRPRTPTLW